MKICQPLKTLGKRTVSNTDTKGKEAEVIKGLMCPRSKVSVERRMGCGKVQV